MVHGLAITAELLFVVISCWRVANRFWFEKVTARIPFNTLDS